VLDAGFEIASTHCNLARIYILTDRDLEARDQVAKAWANLSEAPPYVAPRLLFIEVALALLDGSDPGRFLGMLKGTLEQDNAHVFWEISVMLERLSERVTPDASALLRALSAAIDDSKNLEKLDSVPQWRQSPPEPLSIAAKS
jgi:hypothetical protein